MHIIIHYKHLFYSCPFNLFLFIRVIHDPHTNILFYFICVRVLDYLIICKMYILNVTSLNQKLTNYV